MTEPLILSGCTPEPLMSYLKALGVFRLIAEDPERGDPSARMSWSGGVCRLSTRLDREALIEFFREHYRPTPIVGPWGARSGFYPGSSESSARAALDAIVAAAPDHPRLGPLRDMIVEVRNLLNKLGFSEKVRDEDKLKLMIACRDHLSNTLGGIADSGRWLDAVYVVTSDGRKFPPLLGTGGNEGSGSYVSTFAQVVRSLLIQRKCDEGVKAALFGDRAAVLDKSIAVGHFDPGAIGGPNSSVGFDGEGGTNPWDFLFAIEGTLLFAGAAARRLGIDPAPKAAFPFTVTTSSVGYATAVAKESKSEGQKAPSRAELWLPIWESPTGLSELRYLFSEGRAQIGRRQARSGVEFARALASLGIYRGIREFNRYGILKRNGDSYFASFLGRYPVRSVPKVRLFDELDPWLNEYRKVAKIDKVPFRVGIALRRIDDAEEQVCRYGSDPRTIQAVLRAVGKAEAELATGPKVRADHPRLRPLGGLSGDWIGVCDDGSPEFRLAVSLAFMSENRNVGAFRTHLEPVRLRHRRAQRWIFDESAKGVVWSNVDLTSDLTLVFGYRLRMGTAQEGEEDRVRSPIHVPFRFRPRLADVIAFLDHGTDDNKINELLWGLATVRPPKAFRFCRPAFASPSPVTADYAALKLPFLTEPVCRPGTSEERAIQPDIRIVALLRAGRVEEAVSVACRRLQADGFPTRLTGPIAGQSRRPTGLRETPAHARRLIAALIFPLGRSDADRLLTLAIRPFVNPNG